MNSYAIAHPAEEPLRMSALASVLEGARMTALRSWHPERCDIYHCAQRAWRAQNIPVPFAAVTYQLRRLVDDGKLLDFSDAEGRTREQVAELFAAARDHVWHQYQLSRVGTENPLTHPPTTSSLAAPAVGLAATG